MHCAKRSKRCSKVTIKWGIFWKTPTRRRRCMPEPESVQERNPATGGGAIPKEGNRAGGSGGATEPSSQRKHAAASFSSWNEHARSRASSTGVGVRGDAARSACWFRRITDLWWLEARADAQATKELLGGLLATQSFLHPIVQTPKSLKGLPSIASIGPILIRLPATSRNVNKT